MSHRCRGQLQLLGVITVHHYPYRSIQLSFAGGQRYSRDDLDLRFRAMGLRRSFCLRLTAMDQRNKLLVHSFGLTHSGKVEECLHTLLVRSLTLADWLGKERWRHSMHV